MNEIELVIDNTLNYQGSITLSRQSTEPGGLPEVDKATFNYETKELAIDEERRTYVLVPEEDNLAKYYKIEKENAEYSDYSIASQSYADYSLTEYIDNGDASNMAITALKIASESYFKHTPDPFKTFLCTELVGNMLSDFGCVANPEDVVSSFEIEEKEDSVKEANYVVDIFAKQPDGVSYPQVDMRTSFVADYTDKLISITQIMKFTLKMSENPGLHQTMSMISESTYDYSFDETFYQTQKDKALLITKQSTMYDGYVLNKLSFFINGALECDEYNSFVPNSDLTTEVVTNKLKLYTSDLDYCDIDGIYTDEACTIPFEEKKSTEYLEVLYVKATPKDGYSSLMITKNHELNKGDLPFSDEEFEIVKIMFASENVEKEYNVYLASNDVEIPLSTYSEDALQSMYLDGEKYSSKIIPASYLATAKEHELVLNYASVINEDGDDDEPLSMTTRLINNDENGILFLGPNNDTETYFKLNTEDFVKQDPTFALAAYRTTVLLDKGQALPEEATLLDDLAIAMKFVVDGSELDALPDEYSGEFLLKVELVTKMSFVYISIK